MKRASEYLAEKYPEMSVICSDGSSQAVLKTHNIRQMDAVLPLTNMDEENIIIAHVRTQARRSSAADEDKPPEYGEILGDRGADSLISPKSLSTYAIIRYVRAMENTGGSAVLTHPPHSRRRRGGAGVCRDRRDRAPARDAHGHKAQARHTDRMHKPHGQDHHPRRPRHARPGYGRHRHDRGARDPDLNDIFA